MWRLGDGGGASMVGRGVADGAMTIEAVALSAERSRAEGFGLRAGVAGPIITGRLPFRPGRVTR